MAALPKLVSLKAGGVVVVNVPSMQVARDQANHALDDVAETMEAMWNQLNRERWTFPESETAIDLIDRMNIASSNLVIRWMQLSVHQALVRDNPSLI
jgi:hypothetical protein